MLHTVNSDARAQLAEAFPCQSLGCDVRQLLLRSGELDLHPAIINALPNEVVPDVNMFAAILEDRVATEGDSGLVVDLQCGGAGLLASEFCDQPRQLDSLARSSGTSHVLGLARCEGYHLLLLGLPGDQIVAEEENYT